MTNPYIEAAEQELFSLREDDAAARNGSTMIVRSLLAIAWELRAARHEREVEAECEEHRANVRARMER